jgi:predicted exporter/SAM-dependent methyltransferase
MFQHRYRLPWPLIMTVFVGVVGLFLIGQYRVLIDSDIVASLPQGDPVISDARYIIDHHPIQDRVVIDIEHRHSDPGLLITGAEFVEKRLRESGLFKTVGLSQHQQLFPELISYVTDHFPILFSERDLKEKVEPLLSPENVRQSLLDAYAILTSLEGIGQTSLIARDPLGLRNIVLQRLSTLGASKNVAIVQGQLLSSDKKHLLVIAEPVTSGYDTALSRKISTLIEDISTQLNRQPAGQDTFTLTHVGAYRAALDNETAAKTDTHRAVFISTIAIALLLFLSFPRPWIGLLALLPAIGGTVVALFVYSLFQRSISILAIGFGGAIISFTVDYGIAYLLFLDRPYETHGLKVTKEIWSIGLLAMLTTAVSFAFLFIAGFPALSQLGVFAALGVVFTYIFVHTIYPFLFPTVWPAKRKGILPLQRIADKSAGGGTVAVCVAVLFGILMLFFAKPDFRVDLQSVNTVSPQTRAAEKLIRGIWGDVGNQVSLAVEGKTIQELQGKEDQLADLLEDEMAKKSVASAFVPSMVFPGEHRAKRNFAAWQAFWTQERVNRLRQVVKSLSPQLGFTPGAFASFFGAVEEKALRVHGIPPAFFPLLNIDERPGRGWTQYSMVQPGVAYQGSAFYKSVVKKDLAKVFDPILFSDRLGEIILKGFIRVALIVGVMTFLVALLSLFHFRLTLVALAPTLFSLICTIGTLRLLRQTLGIPVIMVAAIVIGMGTDYALYLVRAYQRYMDEHHPSVGLIRLSVFLSFATTFIGFGVLALSSHALLKTAGMALALGIGYSYLGTVAFVPPFLRRILAPVEFSNMPVMPNSKQHFKRATHPYRHMEPIPRLFARFKILMDPMFPRLADFIRPGWKLIDIGCGYGVPAAWLLAIYPDLSFLSCDPDEERARVAARVLGKRGEVLHCKAQDLPLENERADAILLLDVLHYFSDQELREFLSRVRPVLTSDGRLIIRVTIPVEGFHLFRSVEVARLRFKGVGYYFRSTDQCVQILKDSGFKVELVEPTAPRREETWFIVSAGN